MKNQGFGHLKTRLFTIKKNLSKCRVWGADGGWWLFPTHLKNLHPIGSPLLKDWDEYWDENSLKKKMKPF